MTDYIRPELLRAIDKFSGICVNLVRLLGLSMVEWEGGVNHG